MDVVVCEVESLFEVLETFGPLCHQKDVVSKHPGGDAWSLYEGDPWPHEDSHEEHTQGAALGYATCPLVGLA